MKHATPGIKEWQKCLRGYGCVKVKCNYPPENWDLQAVQMNTDSGSDTLKINCLK